MLKRTHNLKKRRKQENQGHTMTFLNRLKKKCKDSVDKGVNKYFPTLLVEVQTLVEKLAMSSKTEKTHTL